MLCQSDGVTALLLGLLAAAPLDARFVLEVKGLPLAELRITRDGARYVYEATHFLEEGPKEKRLEFTLEPGAPLPEVLALVTRPSVGCRAVQEEQTRKLETLCVDRLDGATVHGRLDDVAFDARYRQDGRLERISLPGVVWTAVSKPTKPPRESPFTQGLEVPQGALKLEPEVPGARWLTVPPLGIGREDTVGRLRCLPAARAELARRPGARLAAGLVVEDGRAFPHAWLDEEGLALDPSVLAGDPVLARRRYLEVPDAQRGTFFLQLFDGTLRLVSK